MSLKQVAMWTRWLAVGALWNIVLGAPLPSYPSKEMISFMKTYGYLQNTASDSPADTLYTEEGFRQVIRQVQQFGGLNTTGELDSATLALMSSPRCGVPDVLRNETEHGNRTKRYIIATPGWRRRRLTYHLTNWAPSLDGKDASQRLKEAFSLWSAISPLRFEASKSPGDADILVSFSRRDHGDGYPFDGPGSTLAHAFFPYQHGNQGGNVHFDSEEEWLDHNGRDKGKHGGVDFLTVATHELGHSLGLAHSTSQDSIMFPYYKGHDEKPKLGYDDVLGMYDLYVRQGMFEDGPLEEDRDRNRTPEGPQRKPQRPDQDDNNRHKPSHTPRYPVQRDEPTRPTPAPTTTPVPTRQPDHGRRPTHDGRDENRPDGPKRNPTNRPPHHRPKEREKTDNRTKIPDICKGKLDAAALLRGELFLFKGQFMWRYKERGMLVKGFPAPFHHFFPGLPDHVKRIDAIYERPGDHSILFFSGRKVWVYTGSRFTPDSPRPLTSLGLPHYVDSLDAAFVWSKNEKTYFFKGQDYWRYDDHTQTMEEGYPMKINSRWTGVPDNVDTAFTHNDGQTYFFKGGFYWRFDNIGVKTDVNFPRSTAEDWIGC